MFSGPWPKSGSLQDGCLYRQSPLVPHIVESESSYWPTTTAQDSVGSGSAAYPKTPTHSPGVTLSDAAKAFSDSAKPTPRVGGHGQSGNHQGAMDALEPAAIQWRTPSVPHGGGRTQMPEKRLEGGHTLNLDEQVLGFHRDRQVNGQASIEASGRLWMTPGAEPSGSTSKTTGRSLEKATHLTSQARTVMGGTARLNPRFVEWLMGLPIGWTALEPLETVSFLTWRRLRSGLCGSESMREIRITSLIEGGRNTDGG